MKNQRLFLILALLLVWSVTEACDTDIGTTSGNPAKSCKQVYECNPNSTTGYYYMQTKHGHSIVTRQVHCEMNVSRCGIKGGWTRVANIRGGSPCPRGWQEIRADGWKRLCVKQGQGAGCSSTHFSTFGIEYDHICGMAKGYQFGSPDAFASSINNDNPHPSINNKVYVDGLSITHGSPRKHVWTFAASFAEGDSTYKANCPCGSSTEGYKPDFVSDHYYCESGSNGNTLSDVLTSPQWYLRDPLWDGFGCRSDSNCCSYSGMPWFCRTLPVKVKDDIEGRLCTNGGTDNENIGIENLEIYIQ